MSIANTVIPRAGGNLDIFYRLLRCADMTVDSRSDDIHQEMRQMPTGSLQKYDDFRHGFNGKIVKTLTGGNGVTAK